MQQQTIYPDGNCLSMKTCKSFPWDERSEGNNNGHWFQRKDKIMKTEVNEQNHIFFLGCWYKRLRSRFISSSGNIFIPVPGPNSFARSLCNEPHVFGTASEIWDDTVSDVCNKCNLHQVSTLARSTFHRLLQVYFLPIY